MSALQQSHHRVSQFSAMLPIPLGDRPKLQQRAERGDERQRLIPLSIVILLAVGSDYNLLVVSRLREEIHAGLNTGIIRGMGATGSVVTSAGLVFAFTMMSMIVSDLRVVGQLGTTIGLGLLVDTLIVRSFMTPSIAAALGRWFWWPLNTFRILDRYRPKSDEEAHTAPIPQATT